MQLCGKICTSAAAELRVLLPLQKARLLRETRSPQVEAQSCTCNVVSAPHMGGRTLQRGVKQYNAHLSLSPSGEGGVGGGAAGMGMGQKKREKTRHTRLV